MAWHAEQQGRAGATVYLGIWAADIRAVCGVERRPCPRVSHSHPIGHCAPAEAAREGLYAATGYLRQSTSNMVRMRPCQFVVGFRSFGLSRGSTAGMQRMCLLTLACKPVSTSACCANPRKRITYTVSWQCCRCCQQRTASQGVFTCRPDDSFSLSMHDTCQLHVMLALHGCIWIPTSNQG